MEKHNIALNVAERALFGDLPSTDGIMSAAPAISAAAEPTTTCSIHSSSSSQAIESPATAETPSPEAFPTTPEKAYEDLSSSTISRSVAAERRSAANSDVRASTMPKYSPKAPGPKNAQYLNVLVAGESGLGKTTFSHSFFCIERPTEASSSAGIRDATTSIEPIQVTHQTKANTDLHIALYDSVGWGNGSPNTDVSIDRIVQFILASNEWRKSAGGTVQKDARLHCCFYFIAPHRLKDIDVEFIRRVSENLLVIPIIAKADAMTVSELAVFKQDIHDQLGRAQIQTYPYQGNAQQRIFAVIGSESLARVPQCPQACCAPPRGAKEVYGRGREYRWGSAIVDNPDHSDIAALGRLVLERYDELQAAAEEKYALWHRAHWRIAFRAWHSRMLHQLQLRAVLASAILCLLIVILITVILFRGVSAIEGDLHSCHTQLRGAVSDLRRAREQEIALQERLNAMEFQKHQLHGEVSALHQRLEAEKHAFSLEQESHGAESSWFLQVVMAAAVLWLITSWCCYHVGRKTEARKRKWF